MHIAVQSLAVQPVHRLADDGRGGAEDEQTRDGRDPRQLDHTYLLLYDLRELLDDDDCRIKTNQSGASQRIKIKKNSGQYERQ